MTWLKWPSCGLVRKNHLKPLSVSAGDEESAFTNGIPERSATWLAVLVTLEKYAPKRAWTFS
jgi:hypothetical protein